MRAPPVTATRTRARATPTPRSLACRRFSPPPQAEQALCAEGHAQGGAADQGAGRQRGKEGAGVGVLLAWADTEYTTKRRKQKRSHPPVLPLLPDASSAAPRLCLFPLRRALKKMNHGLSRGARRQGVCRAWEKSAGSNQQLEKEAIYRGLQTTRARPRTRCARVCVCEMWRATRSSGSAAVPAGETASPAPAVVPATFSSSAAAPPRQATAQPAARRL